MVSKEINAQDNADGTKERLLLVTLKTLLENHFGNGTSAILLALLDLQMIPINANRRPANQAANLPHQAPLVSTVFGLPVKN
jgi:hypothetical protein